MLSLNVTDARAWGRQTLQQCKTLNMSQKNADEIDYCQSKSLTPPQTDCRNICFKSEKIREVTMHCSPEQKQVPRGYIRCDFFIVTHCITVYDVI